MPSKSKAEQALWGMADAIKKGEMPASKSPMAAKIAEKQPLSKIREFASTKTKNLPMHVYNGKVKKIRRRS
jgi:hypothetical protein